MPLFAGALRFQQVMNDRPHGRQGRLVFLNSEAGQLSNAILALEHGKPFILPHLPRGPASDGTAKAVGQRLNARWWLAVRCFAIQQLARRDARQFVRQRADAQGCKLKCSGGKLSPGDRSLVLILLLRLGGVWRRRIGVFPAALFFQPAVKDHRRQWIFLPLFQQGVVGQGAGRDDARHIAIDHALGAGRVFDLIADRHAIAGLQQPPEIAFD